MAVRLLESCPGLEAKATCEHLSARCAACELANPNRVCPNCRIPRDPECFKPGRVRCSVCLAYGRGAHLKFRPRRNASDVARNYGISVERYRELLAKQNNRCAVCGNEQDQLASDGRRYALHVDHDHVTGQIRGLVCRRCNYLIGWMEKTDWRTVQKLWAHISGL